jgi:hypothetical protein
LVFTEAAKVPTQGKTAIFGTADINRIAIGLNRNGSNVDGAVTAFGNNFTTAIGVEDAIKFPNGAENIAFTVGTKDLSINGIAYPSATTVLPIHIYNLYANTAYSLRLDGYSTVISFTTHSVDAVNYANRYSIVFGTGILPVKDIKLTATAKASGVQVDWTTVGETNVLTYAVQRSVDGVSFKDISTVAAENNANASYGVNDSKAVDGTNYHRIKVSGNDGTVSYSYVATATIGKVAASIGAYPNPLVGTNLNVSFNNLESGKYNLSVYDRLGKRVIEKSVTHIGGNAVEQLSTGSHLAAGSYAVRVSKTNGVSYQTQIEVK